MVREIRLPEFDLFNPKQLVKVRGGWMVPIPKDSLEERIVITQEAEADVSVCVLSMGSNVGDRRSHLSYGISKLVASDHFRLEACSRVVESEPWGPVPQGPFLNVLVRGRSAVEASDLLDFLQRIEGDAGRERGLRYGPRTLDIDIIFFGGLVLDTAALTLPHPYWRERTFVHDLLGDVVTAASSELLTFPGVEGALRMDGRLSPGLREVESLVPELHDRKVEETQ